jgi:long-subunit fatty acid transport protein
MLKKIILLNLLSFNLFASGGFENPVPFSAQANRQGTAIESVIEGSEALFINPAGLSNGHNDVSLMLSVMGGYQQGSVVKTNEQSQSDSSPLFVPAIMAKYNVSNDLGIGFGVYGVAGLGTIYHDVTFGNWDSELNSYKQDNFSKLSLTELSLGFGYRINNNFSIGSSVRSLIAKGSFKQSAVGLSSGLSGYGISDDTVLMANTGEFNDLKGTKHGGYKVGFQYQSDSKDFGLGFVYRSEMKLHTTTNNVKGNIVYTTTGSGLVNATTGFSPNASQVYDLTSAGASLNTELPAQYSVASNYSLGNFTVLAGYTLTKYSKNKTLEMTGTLKNSLTGESYKVSSTPLNWKDLNEYKVGLSYKLDSVTTVSGGVVLSSGTTNPNNTAASYAPVNGATEIGVGVEHKITLLNHNCKLNLAVDYIYGKGYGTSTEIIANNIKTPSVGTNTILRNYNALIGIGIEY